MMTMDDDTIVSANKLMKQVVDLMNGSDLDDGLHAMIFFGLLRQMLRGASPERRGPVAVWMLKSMRDIVEETMATEH
jgi:hypothetical protein